MKVCGLWKMRLTGLYGLWNDVVYGNLMFME